MASSEDKPISSQWPGRETVTRADLTKNTVRTGVKGIKVVNSIPKDKIKGR